MSTRSKKGIGRASVAWFKDALSDIVILLGVSLVFYGTLSIYRPAAFVLLGAGLIAWAIQYERRKPKAGP